MKRKKKHTKQRSVPASNLASRRYAHKVIPNKKKEVRPDLDQ